MHSGFSAPSPGVADLSGRAGALLVHPQQWTAFASGQRRVTRYRWVSYPFPSADGFCFVSGSGPGTGRFCPRLPLAADHLFPPGGPGVCVGFFRYSAPSSSLGRPRSSVPQVLSLPLIFLSVTQWKPTEKFCTVRSYLAFNDSLQLWWFSYQPLWLPSPKEKQFVSFLSLEELVTLRNSFQLVGHCICKIERPQVSDELKKLILQVNQTF